MAAYQPHNWQAGQTITAERLNALTTAKVFSN